MLGGHLEADKEPGHLVGKGYLKITFDRVILPSGDLPVPAKVIEARGFKVDKQGDIDGKGMPSATQRNGCFRRCGRGRS